MIFKLIIKIMFFIIIKNTFLHFIKKINVNIFYTLKKIKIKIITTIKI